MLKVYFLLVAVALLANLSGCVHSYYTSNLQPVPLFTEKGQFKMTGSAGGGDLVSTVDAAAYSLTNHLAVTSSYLYASGALDNQTSYMRSKYGELSLGYFAPFKEHYVMEIYGGAGTNSQLHLYNQDSTKARFHYLKYFIQPVIGYKTDRFEIGLSCRASLLNFRHFTVPEIMDGQPARRTYFFLEPAITVRYGWPQVKFQWQYQITSLAKTADPAFNYTKTIYSIGLQVTLPWNRARRPWRNNNDIRIQ